MEGEKVADSLGRDKLNNYNVKTVVYCVTKTLFANRDNTKVGHLEVKGHPHGNLSKQTQLSLKTDRKSGIDWRAWSKN